MSTLHDGEHAESLTFKIILLAFEKTSAGLSISTDQSISTNQLFSAALTAAEPLC
jgi:hypothetical protein